MARANASRQRETVVFIVGVIILFILLILRNGGNYYINYLHQDALRAQFEIDQSYVLLISQAEGFTKPKVKNNEVYNATLVQEFRNKFLGRPTFIDKNDDFQGVNKFEFQFPTTQDKALEQLIRDKQDGFFVHCCYYDGESLSKASELKITRGWESIIMEGDPKRYKALKSQLRTYSIMNAILSESANFSLDYISKILTEKEKDVSGNVFVDGALDDQGTGTINTTELVPALPLGFVAKIFDRTEIDLLILKADGKDLWILKAIVLEDCEVHVIKVHFDENIERFLVQNGYKMYEFAESTDFRNANDAIFYTKKALDEKKAESVLPLIEQLQRAKQNEQQSSKYKEQQNNSVV